jgi:hypothetical protein
MIGFYFAAWSLLGAEFLSPAGGLAVLFGLVLGIGFLVRTWWWAMICPLPLLGLVIWAVLILSALSDAYERGEHVGIAPFGAYLVIIFAAIIWLVVSVGSALGILAGKAAARHRRADRTAVMSQFAVEVATDTAHRECPVCQNRVPMRSRRCPICRNPLPNAGT